MKTPIDKERSQQKQRKLMIRIGAVAYVILLYIFFHYTYVKEHYQVYSGKKVSVDELISETMLSLIDPTQMTITGNSILIVFVATILLAGALFMMKSNQEYKQHDNPDTVKGEARLMNTEDLNEYNKKYSAPFNQLRNDGPENMIISKDIRLAIDNKHTRRNCNTLVIGGSGAGKSRFFASPNILQYNCNFVITDPSSELLRDYGKALEDNGYEIKVFNLTDAYKSNHYNPFHYIQSEKDVFTLVDTFMKNTTPPDASKGDPFWEKSETLLLNALILYLWHTFPEEDQTFSHVVELVNMATVDENNPNAKSPLDIAFEELEAIDPGNLAVEQYKLFKIGAGKTLKSILISVGVRLAKFKLSDIQYLTSKDDFHFESFADSRQAIFIVIPSADTTFNFIVSMLYTQLFTTLYTYAETTAGFGWCARTNHYSVLKTIQADSYKDSDRAKKEMLEFVNEVKQGVVTEYDEKKKLYYVYTQKSHQLVGWRGSKELLNQFLEELKGIRADGCDPTKPRCPNHVRLILDEFANIGQLPDFDPRLATMRKYGISGSIILQALSQLKDLYKDKWNTIVANCDTKLFLGCDDSETIEWMLKMLGKKTVTVENRSVNSKDKSGSTSYNKDGQELMTIDKIAMMQDDECLVRIRGVHPYYGKKYELTEHPNYKYAQSVAGQFEIPVSEDITNRKSGPLWKRRIEESKKRIADRNKNEKKEELPAQKSSNVPSDKKEKSVPLAKSKNGNKTEKAKNIPKKLGSLMKDVKNIRRKENAVAVKNSVQENEEKLKELEESQIECLLNAFGVDENTPDEKIKENVETVLEMGNLSFDNIHYEMTN